MTQDLKKIFAGAQIRDLRQKQKLTQAAFAKRLGISTSYLNLIENNSRSLSASVILALFNEFAFDLTALALDESGRVAMDLSQILEDPVFDKANIQKQEIKIAVSSAPNVVRALLELYAVFERTRMQLGEVGQQMESLETSAKTLPYEEVRDYFHYKDNYVDELDRAAENFARSIAVGDKQRHTLLAEYLADAHGIRAVETKRAAESGTLRRFDPDTQILHLSSKSSPSTNLFQMAYQVGLIEQGALIERLLDEARFRTKNAREVCRMTFANYFAGAVLLPYMEFLQAAKDYRHDLDRLAFKFDASREQVCHRLSMLQRPGHKGIPFFFVRVDRAGTITKRHSATSLQFTRFGGSCPLWNVHKAFETQDEILRQLATTPDGKRYLCLAFSKSIPATEYRSQARKYAIGLGCEVAHGAELVYSDGLELTDETKFDPIGTGCRVCERPSCAHRSVPPLAREIGVDHHSRMAVPFKVVERSKVS